MRCPSRSRVGTELYVIGDFHMPRKVPIVVTRELAQKRIVGLIRKASPPHGTGAKVPSPKQYLGWTVYLGITNEK